MTKRSDKWLFFFPEERHDYPKTISRLYSEDAYATLKRLDGNSLGSATKWELLITHKIDPSTGELTYGSIYRGSSEMLATLIRVVWRQFDALYIPVPENYTKIFMDNPVVSAARIPAQESQRYAFHAELERQYY